MFDSADELLRKIRLGEDSVLELKSVHLRGEKVAPVEGLAGAGRHQYFMERRGDGVPIILEESRRLGACPPEYRLLDDAELLLTIWSAEFPNQIDRTPEIGSSRP